MKLFALKSYLFPFVSVVNYLQLQVIFIVSLLYSGSSSVLIQFVGTTFFLYIGENTRIQTKDHKGQHLKSLPQHLVH